MVKEVGPGWRAALRSPLRLRLRLQVPLPSPRAEPPPPVLCLPYSVRRSREASEQLPGRRVCVRPYTLPGRGAGPSRHRGRGRGGWRRRETPRWSRASGRRGPDKVTSPQFWLCGPPHTPPRFPGLGAFQRRYWPRALAPRSIPGLAG